MSSLAETALNIGLRPAIEFVKDKWNYVWNYKSYVRDLEKECKTVEYTSDEVKHDVEEGKNNGCETLIGVEEWLKDVTQVTKKATEVTKEARDVQNQTCCFRGFIMNPLTRYKIGKEAGDAIQSIQQLETRKSGFRATYYRTAPGKVTGNSYKGISYYDIPSREAMLKEINKALVDPYVEKVGVYGPSGVGKSTLLAQVADQLHKGYHNYDFETVAMATVSQNPDLQKIQSEIAYRNCLFQVRPTFEISSRSSLSLWQGQSILIWKTKWNFKSR